MDIITSRQNKLATHLRSLGRDRAYRRERLEFLCDGEKLLAEAVSSGVRVISVAGTDAPGAPLPEGAAFYHISAELLDYISPLKNSPGPLFSCEIPKAATKPSGRIFILDGVQDPGNVGTVLRSAGAFGIGAVILTGACADPWNFKTVRASMGAVFRVPVYEMTAREIQNLGVPVCGASLGGDAESLEEAALANAAVAIGSEGKGLSDELLALCEKKLRIPMSPGCESLNAAVAASIIMWEMGKRCQH